MKKTCTICNIKKDFEEFSWRNKSKNIKHSQCKDCKKIIDNKHYSVSKKRREDIRIRSKIHYNFLREYIKRLKLFGECNVCGEKRWYVLDFHHINEKNENISFLVKSGVSIFTLKSEIRKCELVCSNCHREIHHFKKK